jgi:hypothetical protein
VNKKAGELWAAMGAKQKYLYETKNNVLKAQYAVDFADHHAMSLSGGTTSTSTSTNTSTSTSTSTYNNTNASTITNTNNNNTVSTTTTTSKHAKRGLTNTTKHGYQHQPSKRHHEHLVTDGAALQSKKPATDSLGSASFASHMAAGQSSTVLAL